MDSLQLILLLQKSLAVADIWQVYVWLLTLSFTAGFTWGTFATKSFVEARIALSMKSIDARLERIEERLDRHVDL